MAINVLGILNEKSYGSGATTITEPIEIGEPIVQLNLTMKFLQNGATLPTIDNVLTQFATTIRVKQDGIPVFNMSAKDLWALDILAYNLNGLGHISDGTGADNQVMFATLVIPFGPVAYPYDIVPDICLPVPRINTTVELDVPADGNNLDNRKLSITAITLPEAAPRAYIERVTKSVTPSGTGWGTYVSLPYGAPYKLFDIFAWQTTNLSDGTTSDVTTIEQIALEKNEKPYRINQINIETLQYNLGNLSGSASSPLIGDEYLYFPLCPNGKIEHAIPLDGPSRIAIYAGDTNALRMVPGLLHAV